MRAEKDRRHRLPGIPSRTTRARTEAARATVTSHQETVLAIFPRREPDIVRLAHDIATGFAANPELFPAPPAGHEQGLALIDAYYGARDASIAAAAAAQGASTAKGNAVKALVEWARGSINYATSLFRKDGSKLQLIGWGPRRDPTTVPETIPGQVGHLVGAARGKEQHHAELARSVGWR